MPNELETLICPELRQAFEETHYTVHHEPPFTLHIGQPCPELDALLRRSGHACAAFLTAWNPMSQSHSLEDNHQRQQSLLNELPKLADPARHRPTPHEWLARRRKHTGARPATGGGQKYIGA
jgi:hypothetical protein